MKLGYDLTIEQSQKLIMTPELIQAIQILQFNTQELETYVEEQLLTNPVLEKGEKSEQGEEAEGVGEGLGSNDEEPYEKERTPPDSQEKELPSVKEDPEFDWAEHLKEGQYDDISYKQWEYDKNPSEYSYEQFVTSSVTLTEHLLQQMQFVEVKKRLYKIVVYIIEALDGNGYLRMPVDQIARIFAVDEGTVEEALDVVQGFDPVGVGARDLSECLLIQLVASGKNTPILCQVIQYHLEDVANNRLFHIAKTIGVSVKEIQEVADVIKTLEPKPGREFDSGEENRYIIPDVTVEKVAGEYVVRVNESSAPKLNISPYYRKMLISEDKDSNISQFLTGRLNSAMWLIKSIEQRRQTIYNVVSAVVHYQEDFFENGDKHLKTLTLRQIADEVGIHESTVSRSINGKYMQTPRGLFEIKYFFTSGVQSNYGEGIASGSIKTIIREIVNGENPQNPYSDQALAEMLAKRGIDISRRTVAKYRDEMNLPSSSKRKRY